MGRLARLAMSGARTGGALLFSRDSAKSALDSAAVLGQLRGQDEQAGRGAGSDGEVAGAGGDGVNLADRAQR